MQSKEIFEKLKEFSESQWVFDLSFGTFSDEDITTMCYPNEQATKRLKVVARHASGSFLALVKKDEKQDFNADLPIAWLDSEGEPTVVFARNIEEAISVLYYGTGFLYDLISNFDRENQSGSLEEFFEEEFPESKAQDYLESYKEESVEDADFASNELGIKINATPVNTIKNAYLENPWLNTWLYE